MQRYIRPELLDDSPLEEKRASLHDLTKINRYLGGYAALRRLLADVVSREEAFSVLDVGAASGDVGGKIRSWYPCASVTSFDYRIEHVAQAPGQKVVGDAFQLPFAPKSFDHVLSSLFLHHFSDDRVVQLLAEFGKVARRFVLANDLDRGPFAYHFMSATRWIFHWDPITLHDAPASVQAGFKMNELRSLAERAGLRDVQVRRHRPWSRLTLAARDESGASA